MKLPKIFLQQLPVSNNKKVWVNSVKLTMAGDDIASPAFNNSKLILKEQRKLLTRKKVDEDFWLAGFNNNKGEHGAKKETKTWLMSKSMHCLVLVFTFMSRSLHEKICWYSFPFMNLNSQLKFSTRKFTWITNFNKSSKNSHLQCLFLWKWDLFAWECNLIFILRALKQEPLGNSPMANFRWIWESETRL